MTFLDQMTFFTSNNVEVTLGLTTGKNVTFNEHVTKTLS